jgi:hypothetical protein
MARIPSDDDLGIRTPTQVIAQTSRGPRQNVDREAYVPRAAISGMKELGERIANEEFAKAEVQLQIGAMQETLKFDADGDIDTAEERYGAALQDNLGKASAGITDRRMREEFLTRGAESVAKGNFNMNKKITAKKNDREKGYMVNAIDVMVKGGQDLEYGDPAEAGLGIQLSLDSMVERQVISNVEAQSMMRKATMDIAYGRLKAMPPEQQLEIIDSDDPAIQKWVSEVPPDIVAGLREEAQKQGQDDMAMAYSMTTRGVELGAAMDEMYRKAAEEGWANDADRIDKYRMRIMRLNQDDEAINQNRLNDWYEEGIEEIQSGAVTVAQIRSTPQGRELMRQMSPAQKSNMDQAEDNAIKREAGEGRRYSERAVVDRLKELIVQNRPVEMRKYWSENYAKLNDNDFTYFNQASSPKKSSNPAFRPIQSTRQVMDKYLEKHPFEGSDKDRKEDELWTELNDMARTYFEKNAGDPPKDLIHQWVKEKHANVVLAPDDKSFMWVSWGGEEHLARDLPPVEKAKYESIMNVYREAGVGAEVGTLKFNGWTEDEREGFRDLRRQLPDEPADKFVAYYQSIVEANRAAAGSTPEAEARVDSESPAGNSGLGLVIPGQ